MRNSRLMVKVRSVQGHKLCQVKPAEAAALLSAKELGYEACEDGSIRRTSYQNAREESPSVITPADMRMNVGESGEPKPMHLRREGYIDPVEAARDKIRVWPEIADVKKEIAVILCPWPREQFLSFAP